ncbi:hypothetical protein BD410DRAFT_829495 [Rickenella mellea]|uniref:Uncharacterized protein n=1 Tax=Rickenella mellea TaxID=50990 RepID=A0A4Y7PZN0_9AGAM|nr:hypothetical protein BD410DRAFT_829495 [Rickenella mellea]
MPASRNQTRDSRRVPSSPSPSPSPASASAASAAGSGGSVSDVLTRISTFYNRGKRVIRGSASVRDATRSDSSTALTRAMSVENADVPDVSTTATSAISQEGPKDNEEVNTIVTNDTLDDGDTNAPAASDASVESPNTRDANKGHPIVNDVLETGIEPVSEDADTAATKDVPLTASIAVGSANPRHASPLHSSYAARFENEPTSSSNVPTEAIASTTTSVGSDVGSTTHTKESVTEVNDDRNTTNAYDNARTDALTSYPVANGAITTTFAGLFTYVAAAVAMVGQSFGMSAVTVIPANGKGKKRAVDELAEEGDNENEGLVRKRARMSGDEDESVEKRREEKGKGKKRVHFDDDDDEVAQSSSGYAIMNVDNHRQAKRARHSMAGPSMGHTSVSPRQPGTTTSTNTADSLPTPEGSQENDNVENLPAPMPTPSQANAYTTVLVDGLLTPEGSDVSDDDSDSGSDDSYSEHNFHYGSTNAPRWISIPPGHRRPARAFYGPEQMEEVFRRPYLDDHWEGETRWTHLKWGGGPEDQLN